MTPEEIKELRLGLGLTQEAFAQLVRVAFRTVNQWERGRTKPSRLAIEKMETFKSR